MTNPFLSSKTDRFVAQAANSRHPVLLSGETGVGKTRLARAIHDQSGARTFIEVNCAELTSSLVESQLFGHRAGAFTGATRDQEGLIEAAHGGTLFLDEIGELALPLQAKLLRVLDTDRYRRVGETRERKASVRLISATNRDLEALVHSGGFRRDLLFRVGVLRHHLPPLRERSLEFAGMVDGLLRQLEDSPARTSVGKSALSILRAHHWPGNLRELRNVLARALLSCGNGQIEPADLPPLNRHPSTREDNGLPGAGYRSRYRRPDSTEAERAAIEAALERAGGVRAQAARLLGMSRTTLWARMREYGIDP